MANGKPFVKGEGGRKKGTLNKRTVEMQELAMTLTEECLPLAIENLHKLHSKEESEKFLDIFVKYMQYAVPKKIHVADDEESLKRTISSIREIIYERGGKE